MNEPNNSSSKNPVIRLRVTMVEMVFEIISAIIVFAQWVNVAIVIPQLTQKIVTHYSKTNNEPQLETKNILYIYPTLNTRNFYLSQQIIVFYLILTFFSFKPQNLSFPVKISQQNVRTQYVLICRYLIFLKILTGAFIYLLLIYQIKKAFQQVTEVPQSILNIFLLVGLSSIVAYIIYSRKVNQKEELEQQFSKNQHNQMNNEQDHHENLGQEHLNKSGGIIFEMNTIEDVYKNNHNQQHQSITHSRDEFQIEQLTSDREHQ